MTTRGTPDGGSLIARARRWWTGLERGWQATILGLLAVGFVFLL